MSLEKSGQGILHDRECSLDLSDFILIRLILSADI